LGQALSFLAKPGGVANKVSSQQQQQQSSGGVWGKIKNFLSIGGGAGAADKLASTGGLDEPYYVTGYPAAGGGGGLVGYDDYDYGDYNEGVGLLPPRPLTVTERVFKWFDGFKPPSLKNGRRVKPRLSVLGGGGRPSLDYDDYETDESGNLVFYSAEQGSAGASASKPDSSLKGLLSEFVQLLKKTNETAGGDGVEVVKRLFNAAVSVSERSDTDDSVFMIWTVPTSLLAAAGLFYTLAAVAIVGYKYTMFISQGDANQAINLIPIAAVFLVPLVIGLVIVTARSSATGELDISRLMSGDVSASMRQDFDGVDFTMDAIFGSSALLGLGWLVSITV